MRHCNKPIMETRLSLPSIATLLTERPAVVPRLDAELLLAHVLERDRTWLFAHAEETVPAQAAARFGALATRRAAGEPLPYLTGLREFWSLPLRITHDVLVPRPETELLVERALQLCQDAQARVADLGTGSGAIALACAREHPQWHLCATDASQAALDVAAANARALGIDNIEFVQGSWCRALGDRRFQMILSNPPYIAMDDPALQDPALRYEPRQALAAGVDGLEALRDITATAAAYLVPGGVLALEHGNTQAQAVATLLVAAGFGHVRCHLDLAGNPRVTEAISDGTIRHHPRLFHH